MHVLMLALIDSNYPQLLRKIDNKYKELRKHFSRVSCYVIGEETRAVANYSFTWVPIPPAINHYDNRIAICANIIEDLHPDVVYMRSTLAAPALERLVKRFSHIVFEYNSIPETVLDPTLTHHEVEYAPKVLAHVAGLVGVTKTIVDHQVKRLERPIPSAIIFNNMIPEETPLLPRPPLEDTLHIVIASHVSPWHGVDRVIRGIANYKGKAILHIAGIGEAISFCRGLASKLGVAERIVFHGQLDKKALRQLYTACHIAIGSIAIHRMQVKEANSIKLVEYTLMGMPFVYAGDDPAFTPDLPFTHIVPQNDFPLSLDELYAFAKRCHETPDLAAQSRAYGVAHLSTAVQEAQLVSFLRSLPLPPVPPKASAPLVSVVIPCYNQAQFLPDTIASIVSQPMADYEIIIVNDGSPDNTSAVAQELMLRYPQATIRLVEQENKGLAGARNAGIATARGQWILPLDSDDKLDKNFLVSAVQTLQEHPEVSAVYGAIKEFGARQSNWMTTAYDPQKALVNNCLPCATMFRRSLWQAVGGYSPEHPWGIEDWHFWLKCQAHGWYPLHLHIGHLHYRVHTSASMYTTMQEHWDESLALHHTMLPSLYTATSIFLAHSTLCTMSDASKARIEAKRTKYPHLALPWFWLGLAHEGKNEQEEAVACYSKALDLSQQQTGQAPDSPLWQIAFRLHALYLQLGHVEQAKALHSSLAKIPAIATDVIRLREAIGNLATTPKKRQAKRILLVSPTLASTTTDEIMRCTFLHSALHQSGYDVHIATPPLPKNIRAILQQNVQNTNAVFSFAYYGKEGSFLPGGKEDLEQLIRSGRYAYIICMGTPDPWIRHLATKTRVRTKVLVLPRMECADYDAMTLERDIREIKNARAVCHMAEESSEDFLLRLANIPHHFTPLPVPVQTLHHSPRHMLHIPHTLPVFVHIADFTPTARHEELIRCMQAIQGEWRMLCLGRVQDKQYYTALHQKYGAEQRLLLREQQPNDWLQAAIAEANILLHTTNQPGYPPAVLSAMRAGVPWLAMPGNRCLHKLTGGCVADLSDMPLLALMLLQHKKLHTMLGATGQSHWQQSFSPDLAVPALINALSGHSRVQDLRVPAALQQKNQAIYDALVTMLAEQQYTVTPVPAPSQA